MLESPDPSRTVEPHPPSRSRRTPGPVSAECCLGGSRAATTTSAPARSAARRGERGAALIEFALIFPFLVVLTLCVVDLSRAFFVKNMLHQAAREGVRALVVRTMADSADARARVNQVLAASAVSASSIDYLGPADRQVGVRVVSQFNWIFPGLFNWVDVSYTNPMTLSAEAWMRQEKS